MHAVALEPGFAKKASRAFVCGGMAGNLIMQEKGWMGYKEHIIHSGEGPIWAIEWRGDLIAWANDVVSRPSHLLSHPIDNSHAATGCQDLRHIHTTENRIH
jgi:hypothetical protein